MRPMVPPDTQGVMMIFKEVLAQVIAWLQQDQRVSYGAIKPGADLWFTEGFDTADLQEAGALLNELT